MAITEERSDLLARLGLDGQNNASIAVSADRQQSFLSNASPDIQSHIESFEAHLKE
ncbi:hypothetical protein [Cryobacterium sp. Y62]|uniref:hypothetical protein n=1 Tax=Cryobacterium sp. Y62 TaxID=2048284 RepID=UPI001E546DF2|nr:hypothetical protein [Cryobacterium sp. Y62]